VLVRGLRVGLGLAPRSFHRTYRTARIWNAAGMSMLFAR